MTQFFVNTNKILIDNGQVKIRAGDASSPPQTATGYLVSGAGDPNFDGIYCPGGTTYGGNYPYWQKTDSSGTYYIMFYPGYWFIQKSDSGCGGLNDANCPDYFANASSNSSPTIGQYYYYNVVGPGPTVTETTCYV